MDFYFLSLYFKVVKANLPPALSKHDLHKEIFSLVPFLLALVYCNEGAFLACMEGGSSPTEHIALLILWKTLAAAS